MRAGGGRARTARRGSATSSARIGGRSLTLRTVRRLIELHPEHAFSLVIGSDLQADVPSWYGADELARTIPFIVVGRAGGHRRRGAGGNAPAIAMPDVSSTAVRAALAAGQPVDASRAARRPRLHTAKRAIQGARMSYMSESEVNARMLAEGPVEPTPSVFIMGAGVVGTALAARLVRASIPVIGLHGRQVELSDAARAISGVVASTGDIPDIIRESDVIIISVRDERVPEVAERLAKEGRFRPTQIVLHTSGANPARTILAPAVPHVRAVGTLHPLVSLADPRVAVEALKEVAFGIEGDEPARATAKRIVRALGARAVFLDAENLALYHAGAVMASNYVVALADTAQTLLVRAGVPPDQALPALIPLLTSVVHNLAFLGLPGALTGPVERGDVSSVEPT